MNAKQRRKERRKDKKAVFLAKNKKEMAEKGKKQQ
jgi:hypothetical protein